MNVWLNSDEFEGLQKAWKPSHNTLNYASTANIEEVMKFYNVGHKTFETDFSIFDWGENSLNYLGENMVTSADIFTALLR